jgi:pilus assembly protein CpaE
MIEKEKNLAVGEAATVERSTMITLFSPKGGIGKTTLTVNLATLLRKETGKKVVVLDLVPTFGNVALMMDVAPETTMEDLISNGDPASLKSIEAYLCMHICGVKILACPQKPDSLKPKTLTTIVNALKTAYDFIVVDTETFFSDTVNTVLDLSDVVVVPMDLSIPSVRNVSLALDSMKALYFSPEKIKLVLNNVNSSPDLKEADVTQHLNWPISISLPQSDALVLNAVNTGTPFVLSQPDEPISQKVRELARLFAGDSLKSVGKTEADKKKWFWKK